MNLLQYHFICSASAARKQPEALLLTPARVFGVGLEGPPFLKHWVPGGARPSQGGDTRLFSEVVVSGAKQGVGGVSCFLLSQERPSKVFGSLWWSPIVHLNPCLSPARRSPWFYHAPTARGGEVRCQHENPLPGDSKGRTPCRPPSPCQPLRGEAPAWRSALVCDQVWEVSRCFALEGLEGTVVPGEHVPEEGGGGAVWAGEWRAGGRAAGHLLWNVGFLRRCDEQVSRSREVVS